MDENKEVKSQKGIIAATFILGILVASVAFYLTPLKNTNIVAPKVKFIKAADFAKAYQENPEDYQLVDIRPEFLRLDYPENALHSSIFNLAEGWKNLPTDKTLVIFCEEGISESVAYSYLEHQGFQNLLAIEGGRAAWKEAGLTLVKNEDYKKGAEPFLTFFKEGGLVK